MAGAFVLSISSPLTETVSKSIIAGEVQRIVGQIISGVAASNAPSAADWTVHEI